MKLDNRHNLQDNFLRDLMKDVKLEEPSDQFTKGVMDEVMQNWLSHPVEVKKPMTRRRWFGAIGLSLLVLLILMITDVRKIIGMLDHPMLTRFDEGYLQPISDAFYQLSQMLIHLPVMIYIIIVALLFLSILDRLLSRVLQLH